MRTDPEWAECPNCHNFMLPKLAVKLDSEISNAAYIADDDQEIKVYNNLLSSKNQMPSRRSFCTLLFT